MAEVEREFTLLALSEVAICLTTGPCTACGNDVPPQIILAVRDETTGKNLIWGFGEECRICVIKMVMQVGANVARGLPPTFRINLTNAPEPEGELNATDVIKDIERMLGLDGPA